MTEYVTDGTSYLEAEAVSGQMNPGIVVYPGLSVPAGEWVCDVGGKNRRKRSR